MQPLSFTARVVAGSGRGKGLGIATMNLDLAEIPPALQEGIYACFVSYKLPVRTDVHPGGQTTNYKLKAGMHYGPRPVFKDTTSCEIHILDEWIETAPDSLTVDVIGRIRDVADFASVEDLKKQIEDDIRAVRAILSAHESADDQAADS